MQDRYVGDVGDYGKFALLRALTGHALRLALVWCRFPDESHNGDGRHLSYLDRADFASLDPDLHAALGYLVRTRRRSLAAVEAAPILPPGTAFFSDPTVDAPATGRIANWRIVHRLAWRKRALEATKIADIVFFDPDNGIEIASVPMSHPKAGKYIFWDDLMPFWSRGQSLVIYHHLNRTASAAGQTKALRARFADRLGSASFLASLLFRRGSCRHFWIVGQPRHARHFDEQVTRFLADGWDQHFDATWRG